MSEAVEKLRVDKWCWMTRFFKTRALATAAIAGGKVHVNGQRVKPAHNVKQGDLLEISRVHEKWIVQVTGIPSRRGPAKEAILMYQETEKSKVERSMQNEFRRAERISRPREDQRPDKHQRKQLRKLKYKN